MLHIHYGMSCQITVVLWDGSFLGFRGLSPGFQFRLWWWCYCSIWRQRFVLTFAQRNLWEQRDGLMLCMWCRNFNLFFSPHSLQQRQKANINFFDLLQRNHTCFWIHVSFFSLGRKRCGWTLSLRQLLRLDQKRKKNLDIWITSSG